MIFIAKSDSTDCCYDTSIVDRLVALLEREFDSILSECDYCIKNMEQWDAMAAGFKDWVESNRKNMFSEEDQPCFKCYKRAFAMLCNVPPSLYSAANLFVEYN